MNLLTEIKTATADDFADIQELRQTLFALLQQLMPDTFVSAPYPKGFLESVLEDESRELYVAKTDGITAGYALVELKTAPKDDETLIDMRYTYLLDFCVAPDYRSKGVGTKLLEEVKAFANRHDCMCIELSVVSKNTGAIEFYERFGFFDIIRRMRCYL